MKKGSAQLLLALVGSLAPLPARSQAPFPELKIRGWWVYESTENGETGCWLNSRLLRQPLSMSIYSKRLYNEEPALYRFFFRRPGGPIIREGSEAVAKLIIDGISFEMDAIGVNADGYGGFSFEYSVTDDALPEEDLPEQLRKGRELRVLLGNFDERISLAGSADALYHLESCTINATSGDPID